MDRRMSDLEALMWTLEKDPHLSSTFANVTVLDRPPDVDRLRRRMERALALVPRLRQRVGPGLGRLAPPQWQDTDVDLTYHIRRIALPAPGTERVLWDLATQQAAEPFDRARPLWRFTVVDGLEGGRSAMVQQLHHTITDGQGGVRMSAEFIDVERDAPEPEPVPLPEPDPGTDGLAAVGLATAGHIARRGTGIATRTAGDLARLARHPERLGQIGTDALAAARSLLRQTIVTDRARSPLWVERTLRRRLEVLQVPLDEVKRSAKALGGSVNDLFVAAVAGGAGAYHRDRGVDVDELRMAMPVSTREGRTAGGNAFSPTRTLVPVGSDPVARFEEIRQRLATTKTEPALRLAGGLAGVANLAPTSLLVRAARSQVESVDFTTSNVRGAPFDLFIAGARIDANFPLGPVAGTAFNATLLSVAGSLDVGVHVDAGAVEDPEALRDAIEANFSELLALG
jgi:diacylglycerol O-acyltransferase / wax synthase